MAKLGRYAAQRRKVEAITDDKTVEVADCGTLFFCDVADKTLTLPASTSAGKGWWIQVVLSDEPGTKLRVASGDGATMVVLITAGDGTVQSDGSTNLDLSGDIGDTVEIVCDGTKMYANGQVDAIANAGVS